MAQTNVVETQARWGADDERGALNLLTPDVVLAATKVCKTGKTYNLGLPVARSGTPVFDYRGAPQRLTLTSQSDGDRLSQYGAPEGLGANEDVIVIAAHNGTHIDALCHVFSDHQLYNGFSSAGFKSHTGATHCGIEKTGGFAGRAVLLDIAAHKGVAWLEPGTNITADDLEACRAAQGVEMRPGDILLFRTGWLEQYATLAPGEADTLGQAGIGLSAVDFVVEHDVAAVGADNAAIECIPFDGQFLAVHVELLVKRGIQMIEHLVLAQMAADRCYEALFMVAPLLVTGGSGSPVNPIAIG